MKQSSLAPTLNNKKHYSSQPRKLPRTDKKKRVKIWLPTFEYEDTEEVAEGRGLTTTTYGSIILSQGLALVYAESLELEGIGRKVRCINVKISAEDHNKLKQLTKKMNGTMEQVALTLYYHMVNTTPKERKRKEQEFLINIQKPASNVPIRDWRDN